MTETPENLTVKMEDLINIAGVSRSRLGAARVRLTGPWYSREVVREATRRAIARVEAGKGQKE
jgi:hypothetical protein